MEKVNTKDKKSQKTKFYFSLLTSHFLPKKAQTAMELAVFGAILIFVVGAIVRQALSAGYMQNQQLRAMRQAMTTSYRYSTGLAGGGGGSGDASHQTASVLFVEDRLTAESAKYAAIDRTPYVASAAATYSRNLFLPVDAGEDFNLPVSDIFINGKHFPLTTARFKRVHLVDMGLCSDNCDPTCTDCSGGSTELYQIPDPAVEWEPNCLEQTGPCASMCVRQDCTSCCTDCSPTSTQTFARTLGCAKLYDVVYNHPGFTEWCNHDGGPSLRSCDPVCPPSAPGVGVPGCNLSADERFDLDRDGATDVPGAERGDFSWQWYLVMGWDAGFELPGGVDALGNPIPNPVQASLLRGEGIVLEPSSCKRNCKSPRHPSVDVGDRNSFGDLDLKRESIMVNTKERDPLPPNANGVDQTTGIIKQFWVMDRQDGDLDLTRGDSDPGLDPGLQKDVKMYSFVRDSGVDGTYFRVEEGRLYAASGDTSQYIRTAQKKDQIDLIERVVQLSNDTGRFCTDTEAVNNDPGVWPAGLSNPVEACGNCFGAGNIQRTCMDKNFKVIIVRSRVADRRGRKWITPTGGDETVDFAVPGVP